MKRYVSQKALVALAASALLFSSLIGIVGCKKEKSVFAIADFSFSGNISSLPATIQFTNKSFGLTYFWEFGDGNSSTDENPSHTYTQFGEYSVRLIANGSNNADTKVLKIRISPLYPLNTVHCDPNNPTIINEVLNPITGRIWMDRNLGASRVATSSNDAQAYGDLYQWGRRADGHQCRNSATTITPSSIDQPTHGSFIVSVSDWRNPSNNNLWQGVNGINNPCPTGFRIPTETEFNAERPSWVINNAAGAFASPLKLALPGYRSINNGTLLNADISGTYWSSTVNGSLSSYLIIDSQIRMLQSNRADGFSIRCIKN